MNKYFKNFILCGDIEHYCLLCQELFRDISDVEKHIRWENHRKSLKKQTFFQKFRKDSIYKIADHFYCEICNVVHSDAATVADHINNERHKALKSNPKTEINHSIGRYDCGYIVINKVILNLAQWNSIVDKKCLLCNISVRDTDEHSALEEHIIKLIQSDTIYEDERYYRKINDEKYHCLTCRKVYSEQTFNNHWQTCENTNDIEMENLQEVDCNKNIENATAEDITKMTNLENQLTGTMQEFYVMDETQNMATCKYCSTTVTINFRSMIEHMKNQHVHKVSNAKPVENIKGSDHMSEQAFDHETEGSDESFDDDDEVYKELIDYGKRRSELAKYGKQHSIKLNFNGRKGWCFVCDRYLPAHMKNFMQHVKGPHHRGNLELQRKAPVKRDPREYKTTSISQCRITYAPQEKEFCINSDYSIDVYSFFLLYQIENDPHFKKTKCFACNVLFPQGQERQHCETRKHKKKFLSAKFIETKEAQEFSREIRPNFYHCGFCNQTFPSLDLKEHHVLSEKHQYLQEMKTEYTLSTIVEINTKCDVYKNLLHYGFGNI